MVVIYNTPRDRKAFDRHYFNVHVPMAKELPGLRGYDVSRGSIVAPGGVSGPYLIATLHFDSVASIREAFASPQGLACAADRRLLAPESSSYQMYLFDTIEAQAAT